MEYNVFGEKVSRARFKQMCDAAKNRRELIAAGLTSRRDLMKMGLLTAGGMLSLLAVGGLVLGQLQILNHSVSDITDSALPSIRASDDIQLSFERLNTLIYRGLNTVDDKEWSTIQSGIDKQRAEIGKTQPARYVAR